MCAEQIFLQPHFESTTHLYFCVLLLKKNAVFKLFINNKSNMYTEVNFMLWLCYSIVALSIHYE